jgi:hypothetical protein
MGKVAVVGGEPGSCGAIAVAAGWAQTSITRKLAQHAKPNISRRPACALWMNECRIVEVTKDIKTPLVEVFYRIGLLVARLQHSPTAQRSKGACIE